MQTTITKQIEQDLIRDLWKQGELSWVLLDHQISMYDAMRKFLDGHISSNGLIDKGSRFEKGNIVVDFFYSSINKFFYSILYHKEGKCCHRNGKKQTN